MTLAVWSLPAVIRGQALWHMSRYSTFHHDSDHGEGVFVWEGIVFHWFVGEFADQLSLTLGLSDEMLL